MCLKDTIKKTLREHYGNFETYLEHKYENTITEKLIVSNGRDKEAWLTYNQVILELKHSLKDTLKVKELQYMLTDDNNPNKVCIDIIEEIKDKTPELERLYNKIRNF